MNLFVLLFLLSMTSDGHSVQIGVSKKTTVNETTTLATTESTTTTTTSLQTSTPLALTTTIATTISTVPPTVTTKGTTATPNIENATSTIHPLTNKTENATKIFIEDEWSIKIKTRSSTPDHYYCFCDLLVNNYFWLNLK